MLGAFTALCAAIAFGTGSVLQKVGAPPADAVGIRRLARHVVTSPTYLLGTALDVFGFVLTAVAARQLALFAVEGILSTGVGFTAVLASLVLHEYSPVPVNLERVLTMLLVHDIVEIEAGDVFVYDAEALAGKEAKEEAAAEKLYGLLPPDVRDRLIGAWREFEARETPEARFANAVDRLMPMLHNYASQGQSWIHHGVRRSQVLEINQRIEDVSFGMQRLFDSVQGLLQK